MAYYVKGRIVEPPVSRDNDESPEEILHSYLRRIDELATVVPQAREEEMSGLSHCVDIDLGDVDEFTRSRLIGFLRKVKAVFKVTTVERGSSQHGITLRACTPWGYQLTECIKECFSRGRDFDFVVHSSEATARGYTKFNPDTETRACREKFDL